MPDTTEQRVELSSDGKQEDGKPGDLWTKVGRRNVLQRRVMQAKDKANVIDQVLWKRCSKKGKVPKGIESAFVFQLPEKESARNRRMNIVNLVTNVCFFIQTTQ